MRLSCRILADVAGVNQFRVANQCEFTEGDSLTVYIQLFDATTDTDFVPSGRRYVPAVGATLQVVLNSIDSAKKITRSATLAYPDRDESIWSFTITGTDKVRGTVHLKLTLTEGDTVKTGNVMGALRVSPKESA